MTNTEIVESVGDRIRELRRDRTIAGMAERAGVTWNTWWRWERGSGIRHRTKPSLDNLARIADALGVQVCLFEELEEEAA